MPPASKNLHNTGRSLPPATRDRRLPTVTYLQYLGRAPTGMLRNDAASRAIAARRISGAAECPPIKDQVTPPRSR